MSKPDDEEDAAWRRRLAAGLGSTIGATVGLTAGVAGLLVMSNAAPAVFPEGLPWIPLIVPPVLLVAGAAIGGGLGPQLAGQSASAWGAAGGAVGSVVVGAVGATPGLVFAAVSFQQAQEAETCGQGCGSVIAGILGLGLAYVGFGVCGLVGAAAGGVGGVWIEESKKELPPPAPKKAEALRDDGSR